MPNERKCGGNIGVCEGLFNRSKASVSIVQNGSWPAHPEFLNSKVPGSREKDGHLPGSIDGARLCVACHPAVFPRC